MRNWKNWAEQVLDLAARIDAANDSGALHIVVSDGNMEADDIEFCLKLPNITADEVSLANDLIASEEELRVFAFWLSSHPEARVQLQTLAPGVPNKSGGGENG